MEQDREGGPRHAARAAPDEEEALLEEASPDPFDRRHQRELEELRRCGGCSGWLAGSLGGSGRALQRSSAVLRAASEGVWLKAEQPQAAFSAGCAAGQAQ